MESVNILGDENARGKESKERLSLRILVADDEPLLRGILEAWFKSMGHEVKVVENGQKLLDELNSANSYDLVISDNDMPQKKGIEVLEEIHSIEKFRSIPFIITTGDPNSGGLLEKKITEVGGYYLAKPYEKIQLSNMIEKVTQKGV